ncbi:MAG: hypothetical protein KTR27_16675 [Leptolyngbyaceae cyanobacterium MAG.088]|nr:hypothetical protein [Leptolyngbyaceae cyanobacterium MAG.088]
MRSMCWLVAVVLLTACSSTPEPLELSPIEGALVRGVNFNGKGGFEIDDYRWTSQADSKANGMMLRDVEELTTDLVPQPATDENTQLLLSSSIAKTGQLNVDQVIYGAEYEIYFWFMENQKGTRRSMSVEIEGEIVETEMGNLPYKGWSRFGPYSVDLSDGELNVVFTTADPSRKAEVMGMLLVKPDNSGSL